MSLMWPLWSFIGPQTSCNANRYKLNTMVTNLLVQIFFASGVTIQNTVSRLTFKEIFTVLVKEKINTILRSGIGYEHL